MTGEANRAQVEDPISQAGHEYVSGLLRAFDLDQGMSPAETEAKVEAWSAGKTARKDYEDGLRRFQEDPVGPVRLRLERFKKRYARKIRHEHPHKFGEEYSLVADLCTAIEGNLIAAVRCREKLLKIAQESGIKLKRGILL